MPKRTLNGVVVSDKQDKTVVVRVERGCLEPSLGGENLEAVFPFLDVRSELGELRCDDRYPVRLLEPRVGCPHYLHRGVAAQREGRDHREEVGGVP